MEIFLATLLILWVVGLVLGLVIVLYILREMNKITIEIKNISQLLQKTEHIAPLSSRTSTAPIENFQPYPAAEQLNNNVPSLKPSQETTTSQEVDSPFVALNGSSKNGDVIQRTRHAQHACRATTSTNTVVSAAPVAVNPTMPKDIPVNIPWTLKYDDNDVWILENTGTLPVFNVAISGVVVLQGPVTAQRLDPSKSLSFLRFHPWNGKNDGVTINWTWSLNPNSETHTWTTSLLTTSDGKPGPH